MRLALLAGGLMLIVAVGLYMGLAGFQQYALEGSRSLASQAICAADTAESSVGRTVMFSLSGLPDGTPVHWSSDEGRAQTNTNGSFGVAFPTKGAKTVSAFAFLNDNWARISCSVSIK